MQTLFTSDLHFGHVNILAYTPQRREYLGLSETDGVTEMNEALVRLWNSQVDYDDTVYIIGDFAMGKVAETLKYAGRLNGHKHLIMGNHDRPHPIMFKRQETTDEWTQAYSEYFESLGIAMTHVFDGVEAYVSHFPYEGDHTEEERYGAYRPPNVGLPLVHGHVHDAWAQRGVQYNVGIDAHGGVFQTEQAIGDYFRTLGFGQ